MDEVLYVGLGMVALGTLMHGHDRAWMVTAVLGGVIALVSRVSLCLRGQGLHLEDELGQVDELWLLVGLPALLLLSLAVLHVVMDDGRRGHG